MLEAKEAGRAGVVRAGINRRGLSRVSPAIDRHRIEGAWGGPSIPVQPPLVMDRQGTAQPAPALSGMDALPVCREEHTSLP